MFCPIKGVTICKTFFIFSKSSYYKYCNFGSKYLKVTFLFYFHEVLFSLTLVGVIVSFVQIHAYISKCIGKITFKFTIVNVNVDSYYQHRVDPKVSPEDVANTMAELIDEGKIKAWGISEVSEDYLRRAHEVCSVSAIQNRYSMLTTEHENIFPVCEELGISFVAFSPMANGFLTGAYSKDDEFGEDDFRSFMPQYTEEGFESAKELIVLLDDLSKSKDATMAQISLAWMINKKDYIIPIPGSTKIKNIESNYQAGNVKLSHAEIVEIDELLEKINVPMFGKE